MTTDWKELMMTEATQIVELRWDEVSNAAGHEFRGAWFQVDRAHTALFDEAAYVDQNTHDQEAAYYPDGLVEGFHLLSLLDHLVNSVCFVNDPSWAGWNYGLDRVRFVSPVTTSDRIRVVGRVATVEPRKEGFLLTLDCTLEVEGRQKPGAVSEWKVLWVRSDRS
jgi:acyl dehydratase